MLEMAKNIVTFHPPPLDKWRDSKAIVAALLGHLIVLSVKVTLTQLFLHSCATLVKMSRLRWIFNTPFEDFYGLKAFLTLVGVLQLRYK